MENSGEARLIARTGAMLFLGAGLVALLNSFALGPLGAAGVDVARMRILASLSLGSAVAVLLVPWHRLPPRVPLVLAVWGLCALARVGAVGRLRGDGAGAERVSGLLHADLRMARPRAAARHVGVVRAGRRRRMRVAHR